MENKKAYFEYSIIDKYECGIVLEGWEVKAIANKQCSITGAYCSIVSGEVYLIGSSIGAAVDGMIQRTRKLLLNKREIRKLIGKVTEKGLTLVPLKIYSKNGKYKLEIALAKGKTLYDKRETAKQKQRELNEARKQLQ